MIIRFKCKQIFYRFYESCRNIYHFCLKRNILYLQNKFLQFIKKIRLDLKKIILIILDGWGIGKIKDSDAINQAKTPVFDELKAKYSYATLTTFGKAVGLPKGQMGNSEVGHLNLGAGRVVKQELARINEIADNNEFILNTTFQKAAKQAIEKNVPLHLMGLLSDGGIHAHINHLKAMIKALHQMGVPKIYIHAFLDGRDTDPKSGIQFVEDIETFNENYPAVLASVIGRYYAMDRDKRWERIKKAYDLLVHGLGTSTSNFKESIQHYYDIDITDEFMEPIFKIKKNGESEGSIKEGDVVVCFNFRTDRCRQISEVLTQNDFPEWGMNKLPISYFTLTEYDENFEYVSVILPKEDIRKTLGEVIAQQGLQQLRIAETEKYPHVTYFFSGGRESPFEGEARILINSPKVATYDLKPEMSALEVSNRLIEAIQQNVFHLIIVNYANADMVGHTGVFKAAKKAAETVDACLGKVIKAAEQYQYVPIVIADHGNADFMINEDGSPNTAHTTNLVPIIVADKKYIVKSGKLADMATSILSIMKIKKPEEMDGDIIIEENFS